MKKIKGTFSSEDPHSETATCGRVMKTVKSYGLILKKMIKHETRNEHSSK